MLFIDHGIGRGGGIVMFLSQRAMCTSHERQLKLEGAYSSPGRSLMNLGADFEHAWLELALIVELSPRQADLLVRHFGSPSAVLGASEDALVAAGASAEVAAAIRGADGRAAREMSRVQALGGRIVPREAADYPRLLREIPDPPLALTLRGSLDAGPCVAIVGARRASEYGRRVAFEIARDLARAGITIVSGLANGIDAAAHRGALEAGGRTLAVLGTGIDVVYPSWHAELAASVAAHGALVTEFPSGTPPLRFHFPRRNRVISGLSHGTIVVEATEDSGSLLTAAHANEQGRAVFAVPGRLGSALHHGPHRLIREGARLIRGAEDVLEELAPQLGAVLAARRAAAAVAGLSAAEQSLLAAIERDGLHVDEVIRRAAVPAEQVLETLLALELRGLVSQLPGKRFRRAA
jgi:DNA processing protein